MRSFETPVTVVAVLGGFFVLDGVRRGAMESLIVWPRDLLFAHRPPEPGPSDSPHLGTWIDDRTGVIQHLKPDGRYDETRNGRKNTYVGDFWVSGDTIVYHDDLDFWAFGRVDGDTLVHADFRFRRG
jgi:hypothetical protein